jgi:hypothetical protein
MSEQELPEQTELRLTITGTDTTVTIATKDGHPLLTPEERHEVKIMGEFRLALLMRIRDTTKSASVAGAASGGIENLVSALTKLGI